MRRHQNALTVFQDGRLVGRRRRLALHHRVGLDHLHDHAVRQADADRLAFVALHRDDHAVLQKDGRIADHVGVEGELLVGFLIHEGVLVAVGEEELVFLLVEAHALDGLGGAEALVELGAVADVLELDLQIGPALAWLGVLDLDRSPETALMLDDVARTDGVAVYLHGA